MCVKWCMMCDVQTWFFVTFWHYEPRGDKKYVIWVISYIFGDIPNFIPSGRYVHYILQDLLEAEKGSEGD